MRDALERLDTLYPGMMLKFGGHAMAAGLSLEEDKFELFQQRFGELVTEWLDPFAIARRSGVGRSVKSEPK